MPEAYGSVSGSRNDHTVKVYALSTCVWCRKTKQFLEDAGVAFSFIYVDLLRGQEREEAMSTVHRWNPAASFPTVVIDGTQSVVGHKPEQLTEALGL